MPTGPSKPHLPAIQPARQVSPSPKPRSLALEQVKEAERSSMRRRKGFMSAMITKGGLGAAQTEKTKVLGV
jgi:hypothetical protein